MLDVRGLSCPEPVILVKKALQQGLTKCEVLADSQVSVENIRKMATYMGFTMQVTPQEDEFHLVLERQNG